EGYTRLRAKLVMRERGAGEIGALLAAWVKSLDPQSPDFERDRLEALWAYECVDTIEPALLRQVLASKDYHARAAAIITLSHWAAQIPDALDLLTTAVQDE